MVRGTSVAPNLAIQHAWSSLSDGPPQAGKGGGAGYTPDIIVSRARTQLRIERTKRNDFPVVSPPNLRCVDMVREHGSC